MKKILCITVLLAVGGALCFATGGEGEKPTGGQPINIIFSNHPSGEETGKLAFAKVFDAFQKAHPEFKISNLYIPADTMTQMLVNMTMAGNAPDVMMTGLDTPFTLDGLSGVLDLNPYLSQSFKDDLQDSLRKACTTKDGRLIQVSYQNAPQIWWANKKILAKAGVTTMPRTFAEFTDACVKIKQTQPDVYPIGFDTVIDAVAFYHLYSVAMNFGPWTPFMSPPLVNHPQMKKFLTWYRDLIVRGLTPPAGNSIREFRELVAKEKMAFQWDGGYLRAIMKSIDPKWKDDALFDDTMAPIPIPYDTDALKAPRWWLGTSTLAASKTTKSPKGAAAFIEYWINSDYNVQFCKDSFLNFPLKSQYTNAANKDFIAKTVSMALENKYYVPYEEPVWASMTPKASAWIQLAFNIMGAVEAGKQSIDQILADAETKALEIYNKK